MDDKCFATLSKFTVSARKVIGSVNPSKLISDKHYATEIFWKVHQLGDEVLILQSLDLQNQLGMFTAVAPAAVPISEKKYTYGARN
jgi:hypothetical protein